MDDKNSKSRAWVYRLTRNRMIDHKRKHGRMEIRDPEIMSIVADDEVPSAEDYFIEDQTAENLHTEILRLTTAQQEAIRMAYMEFFCLLRERQY